MTNNDPRSLLATSPMSTLQIIVCTITVFLNALDGFDLLAVSFATPGIMKEFQIPPSIGLGVVLSMDLWGMAVGSFVLGGVADYVGRRRAILVFLVLMAIGMFFCSRANDLADLRLWRFFTGLGIGGMLAAINATAAEFSNDRMRKFWVALMTIGYPLGNILAALIISPLLKAQGWRVVFELGAGATAAMIPVVWFCVPESVSWLCRKQPANALERINGTLRRMGRQAIGALPAAAVAIKAPLADVFKGQYLKLTLLLVVAYFAHIISFYYILKWVAPIVSQLGYPPSTIADVLFWASVGGATGGAVLGLMSLRLNLIRLTSTVLVLGMIGITIFGRGQSSLAELKLIVAVCGMFTNAGIVGLYTLLALAYPTHLRATGTGVVIGAGRGGAALAPILAGYLFGHGMSLQTVSIVMGCGSLIAAVALLFVKFADTSEARPEVGAS